MNFKPVQFKVPGSIKYSNRKVSVGLKKARLVIPLIFILLLFILIKIFVLEIKNIQIINNGADCISNEQVNRLIDLKDKNILNLDKINIVELNKNYPCISAINIQPKIPAAVKIDIIGRKALARVAENHEAKFKLDNLEATPSSQTSLLNWTYPIVSQSEYLVVDKDGFVYRFDYDNNLPLIFIDNQNVKIGSRLGNEKFTEIDRLFPGLIQLKKKIDEISDLNGNTQARITGESLQILLDKKLVFSLNKDVGRQLASLQLILEKAKIGGEKIDMVDLRFDNPVVIYSPKKGNK